MEDFSDILFKKRLICREIEYLDKEYLRTINDPDFLWFEILKKVKDDLNQSKKEFYMTYHHADSLLKLEEYTGGCNDQILSRYLCEERYLARISDYGLNNWKKHRDYMFYEYFYYQQSQFNIKFKSRMVYEPCNIYYHKVESTAKMKYINYDELWKSKKNKDYINSLNNFYSGGEENSLIFLTKNGKKMYNKRIRIQRNNFKLFKEMNKKHNIGISFRMENEIDIIVYNENIKKNSNYYGVEKLYNLDNDCITEFELDCKLKDLEFLEEKLEKTSFLKEEYFDSIFFEKKIKEK